MNASFPLLQLAQQSLTLLQRDLESLLSLVLQQDLSVLAKKHAANLQSVTWQLRSLMGLVDRIVELEGDKRTALKCESSCLTTLGDFQLLKAVGKGGFGAVFLARYTKEKSKRLYALKAMHVPAIRHAHATLQILRERSVMAQANKHSDLFVRMLCAFQHGAHLVLVMEYMPVKDSSLWFTRVN